MVDIAGYARDMACEGLLFVLIRFYIFNYLQDHSLDLPRVMYSSYNAAGDRNEDLSTYFSLITVRRRSKLARPCLEMPQHPPSIAFYMHLFYMCTSTLIKPHFHLKHPPLLTAPRRLIHHGLSSSTCITTIHPTSVLG